MAWGVFMKKRGLYGLWKVNLRLLAGITALVFLAGAGAVLTVRAAAARPEEEFVELPVVMYHSVVKDESQHGKYVISPDELEDDLKYLKEHGYTTILISDLIAYTRGGSLPERPVLLTFDDGYYNNYLYAFALAKRYESKFVISPIGYYADLYTETGEENAYYTNATWHQLKEMADSGLVEVQNHSYNMHKSRGRIGVKKLGGETEEQYRALLTADLQKAQDAIEENVGARPTAFVYPFGAISKATPDIVKDLGFSCTLGCEEKITRITRDPDSLFEIGRFLRISGISSQEFFENRMKLTP